jgi:hypothetical protein
MELDQIYQIRLWNSTLSCGAFVSRLIKIESDANKQYFTFRNGVILWEYIDEYERCWDSKRLGSSPTRVPNHKELKEDKRNEY